MAHRGKSRKGHRQPRKPRERTPEELSASRKQWDDFHGGLLVPRELARVATPGGAYVAECRSYRWQDRAPDYVASYFEAITADGEVKRSRVCAAPPGDFEAVAAVWAQVVATLTPETLADIEREAAEAAAVTPEPERT